MIGKTKLFVSDAIREERLAITLPRTDTGHLGWKKLSTLYKASFAACGFRITPVIRPEIYRSEMAHKILGITPGDWHLAVKPIEHLRPFHGLPNVFICDWPYPEVANRALGVSPFYHQAQLLSQADAVLCCTEFTTQALRRAGIDRAITLPPVLRAQMRYGTAFCRSGRTDFFFVMDHVHKRLQFVPAIEGFLAAAQQNASLRLTVCVQDGDEQILSELRGLIRHGGVVSKPRVEETICLLNPEKFAAAMSQAQGAFFLCTHPAPGLYIPMVEAMLAGLPLVTTMTAGTASFVTPGAAIPIATRPQQLVADDEPISQFLPLTANPTTADAVRDAVLVAASLDGESRAWLRENGRGIAERQFGHAAFKRGLRQIGFLAGMETL